MPDGERARRRPEQPRARCADLPASQRAVLERYIRLVLSWRDRLNLTAAGTYDEAVRVLVDAALEFLPYLPERGAIVDVGSGAGTPGLPIAVARPGVHVVLVDASRRKAGFLEVAVRELGLFNVDVVCARAESLGRAAGHRERYDAATARAVAPLPVLVELVLPLIKVAGVAVLPRGASAGQALREAAGAIRMLGGRGAVRARHIVVVQKISPTPPAYPRRPGVPARRPLEG